MRTFVGDNPELERTQHELEALKRELARIESSSPIAAIGKGQASGTAVIQVMDKAIEPNRKSSPGSPRLRCYWLASSPSSGPLYARRWTRPKPIRNRQAISSTSSATLPGSRIEFLAGYPQKFACYEGH